MFYLCYHVFEILLISVTHESDRKYWILVKRNIGVNCVVYLRVVLALAWLTEMMTIRNKIRVVCLCRRCVEWDLHTQLSHTSWRPIRYTNLYTEILCSSVCAIYSPVVSIDDVEVLCSLLPYPWWCCHLRVHISHINLVLLFQTECQEWDVY